MGVCAVQNELAGTRVVDNLVLGTETAPEVGVPPCALVGVCCTFLCRRVPQCVSAVSAVPYFVC